MTEKKNAALQLQLELFPAEPAAVASPPLVFKRLPADLHDELNRLLRGRLAELVLTANRERILSARRLPAPSRQIALRLDSSFLAAPTPTLAAVASWVSGGRARRRQALVEIRAYFDAAHAASSPSRDRRQRPVPIEPRGATHDLAALFLELNGRYFDHRIEADITWGSRAPKRRRRTIQLGIYRYDQRLIRIHPVLDHPSVPDFVVAAVVFHEMLHAWFPPPATDSPRRCLHGAEFRRAERRFDHHEMAERWIAAHLNQLLARA